MERETISVLVPVYNAAERLGRCMKSLLGQTYRNLEILLLDDGSADGSGALCDGYAAADSRVRVFHLPHGGVAAARNAGLEKMTGELFAFADADDLMDLECMRRLYEILTEHGTSVSVCMAQDCRDTEIEDYRCEDPKGSRLVPLEKTNFLDQSSHRVIWGALYRREVLADIRFETDYRVSTDTLFFAQILKKCRCIAHTDERLYCYILYPVSVSHGEFDRKKYDDVLVWQRIAALFQNEPGLPGPSSTAKTLKKRIAALVKLKREKSGDKTLYREILRSVRWNFAPVRGMRSAFSAKEKLLIAAPDLLLPLYGWIGGKKR